MSAAYYNEIDPFAAQWLRNLIAAGHIANGEVDTRSIEDVQPEDVSGFTQCHFFAGIGVWSHALRKAGWTDDRPVWTGSCPCQPFSQIGKRGGVEDERHLWPEWMRLIRVARPAALFGEQVASNDGLDWLSSVRVDLETEGYAVGASDLCAAGVGAPHIRQRLYWMGHSDHERLQGYAGDGDPVRSADTARPASETGSDLLAGWWGGQFDWLQCSDGKQRAVQSGTFPMAHGIAARVGRVRAYGNALVGPLAETFVRAAMECIP